MSGQEITPQQRQQSVPPEDRELGTRFLLADFELVRRFKEQSVAIADRRIDVYLTLASALGGGLVVLSQLRMQSQAFLTLALISLVILLIIGASTVSIVIDRDILIVDYIRAGNRIRAYFAERAPDIKDYLLMPTAYDFPPYGWQSSNRQIAIIGNGVVAGAIASIISLLVSGSPGVDQYTVTPGIIVSASIYLLQRLYALIAYRKAEAKAKAKRSVSLFGSHQGFLER
jgi:hypothetical protein